MALTRLLAESPGDAVAILPEMNEVKGLTQLAKRDVNALH